MYRLAEFCAGTGAFSIGFKHPNVKLVYANDYDKNSKRVFDMNFDVPLDCRDIHSIPDDEIPQMDILTAGFPCQPYSLAGKKLGFADERSNVFWKLISIIKHHRPAIVVLENVKNILTHNKGDTIGVIKKTLCESGYNVRIVVVNTSKVSDIPHNRERVYFLCVKDRQVMFEPPVNETMRPLREFYETSVDDKYYYTDKSKIFPKLMETVVDQNTVYQYRRTFVRENKSGVCPCLTANMGSGGHNVPIIKDDRGIRKLTPRETFNLQGFPKEYKIHGMSDASLYKLAGNAVSIPVVQMISRCLLDDSVV